MNDAPTIQTTWIVIDNATNYPLHVFSSWDQASRWVEVVTRARLATDSQLAIVGRRLDEPFHCLRCGQHFATPTVVETRSGCEICTQRC